ncbi:EAL domain, c-di-GMP-specific phosphodiesterase class I (or its enzymatically inactive variant) [Andreprevotia lacus DSM 23236]|uniref:EAL domain, c-di-GMP-specific phosphodiesterase class I (Or its enzymatically inactive variant) n=1 Tax=Andreprevotia lacus DSM 23236 TaxID=1121001 RepID=A0A1W1XRP1_9NEIS|nr:EAL domain-containing protein [Andreprevotia lacus]SMC26650.1 EAL domain, c-di-GMP-specific phosphodiesterase class I (or its enzymatically inactive variant) [Andreprevotia lacus DSM 23236]
MSILTEHLADRLPVPIPLPTLEDWPNAEFLVDPARGITVKALGLNLASVFQPIFNAAGQVVAQEALLRATARGRPLPPMQAFASAASQQLVAFDRLCRTLHLLNYATFQHGDTRLFLNVHPQLLVQVESRHGEAFGRILDSLAWSPERVVLEITEDAIPDSRVGQVRAAIESYRARGYGIAIDDFGSRHANLDRLWTFEPTIVKVDRELIARAEHSAPLRRALPKLVELLHELEAEVIVEGIETSTQHQLALDAGADAVQGFHLGEPRYFGSSTQLGAR